WRHSRAFSRRSAPHVRHPPTAFIRLSANPGPRPQRIGRWTLREGVLASHWVTPTRSFNTRPKGAGGRVRRPARCRAPLLISSSNYPNTDTGAVPGRHHAASILGKAEQPVRSFAVFQTAVDQRARPTCIVTGYAAPKRDIRQTTSDLV